MSAVLRNMTLRLWLTALTGGLIGLALLPLWQRAMGIQWLAAPCLMLLAACYVALGWSMNRLGMILIRRHLKEAAVWERAGMSVEAETAFQKAVALFDSFWLSIMVRRKKTLWFQGVLARFYMGSSAASPHARSQVAGYLIRNPEDADIAEYWLEQLMIYPSHLHEEHEAAARVGAALDRHQRVQQLLMQFYLASGRMDFDTRQTCRRVWQSGQPLSDEMVCKLARMLLEATALSPWALQVYLKAHLAGEANALEGLAACVRWLPPTEENRGDLTAAKAVLTDIDRDRCNTAIEMTSRFQPVAPAARPKRQQVRTRRPPRDRLEIIKPLSALLNGAGKEMGDLFRQRRTRVWLLRMAIVILLAVVLGIAGRLLFRPEPETPPETAQLPDVPVITDPFTIQVAAYLNAGDAQSFVDQLVEKGLAAFWTKAASANRTWYQVKVSHFATKAEAQAYGNDLKSKGLIDDFYVANYEPPVTDGS